MPEENQTITQSELLPEDVSEAPAAAPETPARRQRVRNNLTKLHIPEEQNNAAFDEPSDYDVDEQPAEEIPSEPEGAEPDTEPFVPEEDAPDTGEEAPADSQPEEAPAEPVKLDAGLVNAARSHGLPDDWIQSRKSNENLFQDLSAIVRAIQARTPQQPQPQQPTPAAPETAKTDPEPDFKLDLGEDVDPSIAQNFSKMNEFYQRHIGTMRQQMQQMQGQLQQAQTQAQQASVQGVIQTLDSAANELGEGYAEKIGKGGIQMLPQGSEQQQNRMRLYVRMRSLEQEYAQYNNGIVPSSDVLAREAARSLWETDAAAQERKKIVAEAEQANKRVVAKPTQRGAAKRLDTPEKRASAEIAQIMGVRYDPDDEQEF